MNVVNMRHATAFISSTFSDMGSERNLVMYHVLPKVKKWAFDRGILFDIIDLRWGINDEQAQDLHHTIRICLQKVQESDPLFVCFLGERYGWIPSDIDFHQGMFDKNIDKYKHLSATELEIVQALEAAFFDSAPKSCVFLFREQLDFYGVPEEIRKEYADDGHRDQLNCLKQRLSQSHWPIEYSAKFKLDDESYALHDFRVNDDPLEEILFQKLTDLLAKKYQLKDSDATLLEDELTRQQYHLQQLLRFPRIDDCHRKLNHCLSQTRDFEISLIGLRPDAALTAQIAHFISEKQFEQRIMYRFMGIDERIDTANNLITSIAYELSNNTDYLDDPISSLFYVKNELESRNENILLVVAGMTTERLADCFNMLRGLNFGKILLFIETDTPEALPYSIGYTGNSFESLAKHLFEKKAKALTATQLERVVQFSGNDHSLLKLIVNYLCSFATYETLDQTILQLTELDKFALTKQFITRLTDVQNRHFPAGVMKDVLELLCNTPLPLTKEDIVDTILLSRYKDKLCTRDNIQREVEFSLAFASEYIEEYNARFIIKDETLKTVVMFDSPPSASKPCYIIPKNCVLMLFLRTVYMSRLYSKQPFTSYDAHNLCEIIKDYSSPDFRSVFIHTVVEEVETFYALASVSSKRYLVDLFKTLSVQSLGHDVESYFYREMKKRMNQKRNSLSFTQSIITEKLFSVSRKNHPENVFLDYYSMALSINENTRASLVDFRAYIDGYFSDIESDVRYHKLQLPVTLNINSHNTTCYTTFDKDAQAYVSCFCHCDRGFAIIGDIFTGEPKRIYGIPRNAGNIIGVFYQERTIFVVFQQGIITQIDIPNDIAQSYRFTQDSVSLTHITHYYQSGYQVAIENDRSVVIYRGMRKQGGIGFKEGLTVLAAFEASATQNGLCKLIVIVKVAEKRLGCYLIDLETSNILFAYTLYCNTITSSFQDEHTGVVYLQSDEGISFILKYNGDDALEVDADFDHTHFSSGRNCIVSRQDDGGIYFNNHLIAHGEEIRCCFASRKMIGFITGQNTLYYIDNGY